MNHTIRLPIDCSENQKSALRREKARIAIIAASENHLYIIVSTNWELSLWSGHALISTSWNQLNCPALQYPRLTRVNCALSSDGRSLCFGCTKGSFGHNRDVTFECEDVTTGQSTAMCTIVHHSFNLICLSDTRLGWLALGCGVEHYELYMITPGEAVMIHSFFQNHTQMLLGYNILYVYDRFTPTTLTVFPLKTLEQPQKVVCSQELGVLYESNAQLYGVEHQDQASVLREVSIDGGFCNLEKNSVKTSMPLNAFFDRYRSTSRPSFVDSSNLYSVFLTDGCVCLNVQSHSPASLQSLALLSIQKMFGTRGEFKYKLQEGGLGQERQDTNVCEVWQGGITIEEFKERFGCRRKLF